MAKPITGAALALLNQETGTEPVLLVQANFGLEPSFYAERTLSNEDGLSAPGKILAIGEFNYQKKSNSAGASGSTTITLDDSDGAIKFAYDNTTLEQKPIIVSVFYPGTSLNDAIPLLIGKITGPITWSEGERKVSFSIETDVQSNEIGYSPTPDDFDDLSPDAYQVPWPIVFGKCEHVPAVKIRSRTRGFLRADARLSSDIYKASTANKIITFADQCKVISYIRDDSEAIITKENYLYIEGGDKFPRDKKIKIIIDNIVFEGTFGNDDDETEFKINTANQSKYGVVKLGARETIEDTEDPYKILWLEDETIQIAGMHCYFKAGADEWHNICVRQIGKKCYFANTFINPANNKKTLMNTSHQINGVYGTFRNGLHKDRNEQDIAAALRVINNFTRSASNQSLLAWAKDKYKNVAGTGSAFFELGANEEVRLWNEDDPDIYIANLAKSNSIDGVYVKSTQKFSDGKTRQTFTLIPKSWYEVQLEANYPVHGTRPTGLIFHTPIQDRNTEGTQWDETIYVSLTSNVGPNISDIIKFILTRYTDVAIDDSTFNHVKTIMADIPANFVLNTQENALRVAEEIAWQARCVLIVDSGIAYLRCLAETPSSVMQFNNSNIQLKSLEEFMSDLQDVRTKVIATWYDTFKNLPIPSRFNGTQIRNFETLLKQLVPEFNRKADDSKIVTYKNNVSVFGEVVEQVQIRIYNNEDTVRNVVDFWGGRLSNIWKKLRFKTFIPGIQLQPFDCVQMNVTGKVSYNTPAVVESVTYDHVNKDVEVVVWLPIVAGTSVLSSYAWPGV